MSKTLPTSRKSRITGTTSKCEGPDFDLIVLLSSRVRDGTVFMTVYMNRHCS